ncbi:MAG TPA: hypothetical protein VMJ64_14410 [Anaerolineales bacterium]|nr:hypothetical protein [Anaerolineales bacterium]
MSITETPWIWAWEWWGTLVALNAIQLIIGIFLFMRSRKDKNPADAVYLRIMRTMGLVFVAMAFYRSMFVSSYLEQLAWFDSVLNSSLGIRCLAIAAELSFAGLIAKTLLRMNRDIPELINPKNRLTAFLQTKTPIILFACICIANVFATAATITKVDLLFALEETFWGIGFLSIIPMLIISLRKLGAYRRTPTWDAARPFRIALIWIMVFSIGYALFEWGFNLPIVYWPQAITQLQMSNPVPAFQFGAQAVRNAFLIVHETKDLQAWGGMGFVVWHTGYFTICVWIVLFLMTGPRLVQALNAASERVAAPLSHQPDKIKTPLT